MCFLSVLCGPLQGCLVVCRSIAFDSTCCALLVLGVSSGALSIIVLIISLAHPFTGIMSFQKRKQWEGMFEDGVIVEGIETGEAPSLLLTEDTDESTILGATAPLNTVTHEEGRKQRVRSLTVVSWCVFCV